MSAPLIALTLFATTIGAALAAGNGVSWPFPVSLTFWLGVPFLGLGRFARFHTTVAPALQVGSHCSGTGQALHRPHSAMRCTASYGPRSVGEGRPMNVLCLREVPHE